MANTVEYIIKLSMQNADNIKKIAGDTNKLNSSVDKATTSFKRLGVAIGGLFAIRKINGLLKDARAAYLNQSEAETKLAQVMKNTMNARDDEIKSILDLTAAQQKLGVVGDEVQLAGAQELATYLTKKESLEKIIPVMNDMLVQQYGFNASQEQAMQIASMLGKVMDGQVGALSRYGYKFDETQEKLLKTGTEAQRAAVLFDVVSGSVGGINEAFAKLPEGMDKQYANDMGDIQERLGKIVVTVRHAMLPLLNKIRGAFSKVVAFIEKNQDKIILAIQKGVGIVFKVFKAIWSVVKVVRNVFTDYINKVKQGNPLFVAQAVIIGAILVLLVSYKAVLTVVRIATAAWAVASAILNGTLAINPVLLVVAAIVALVAVLGFVIYKTDGWGKTWQNIVTYLTTSWELFVGFFKLKWLQVQDFFMSGIEIIQTGWYKLQKIWDKDAANAGLAELAQQRNNRAAEIAATKGKNSELQQQLADMKVWELSWDTDKSLSGFTNSIFGQLGIASPGTKTGDVPDSVSDATDAIATGGTRSTNVTINIGNVVENMSFNQAAGDNIRNMEDQVLNALMRVINTSQSGVN